MKYTIDWSERKTTSTGKIKMDATLRDEAGHITNSVSIWQDFPNFTGLMTGHDVEGDLVPAKDPKYGPTLYPKKEISSQPKAFQPRTGAIKQAMEQKAESIGRFQDNKELSIKVSSTLRMAVDTALAFFHASDDPDGMPVKGFEENIRYWRKFYWMEWAKEDKDFPPFI